MWVNEFYNVQENIFIDKWHFGNKVAFMELYIFKGNNFFITGNLSFHSVQKHPPRYTIKIHVTNKFCENKHGIT